MIVLPRGLARSFRAVARSCPSGRPRGPAPPVRVAVRDHRLSLAVAFADVTATVTVPAPSDATDETVIVPGDAFAGIDTAGEVVVEAAGRLRWAGRSGPGEIPFDPLPIGAAPMPPVPGGLTAVPPAFLAALHECGRTTADESGRYALSRVQVRGRAGQVIGTDGATALVRTGFALPFADDVLVPAVRAFGRPELATPTDVRVGRTDTLLVVAAGPWTIGLRLDRGGRYPDVAGVVPRRLPTTVEVGDADTAAVTEFLNSRSDNDDNSTVTLIADRGVTVRSGGPATGPSASAGRGSPARPGRS